MTNANECTCPSGDGSLRHPCPAHPAPVELAGVAATLTFINGRPAMCGCQVEYSSGGGEYSDVIYVTLCAKHSGSAILDLVATNRIALTPEYEGQWHADLYLDREIPLAKAEGATPAEAVLALMSAERIDPEQESVEQAGGDERVIGWRERILAAHPNSDPGFWPDALLVEHMAAEIADLRAALTQPSPASDLDPLNLAPHAKAFNEAPAEALKPGQAEEERPKIVATLFTPNEKVHDDIGFKAFAVAGDCDKDGGEFYDPEKLMTVAQHERIVGDLQRQKHEADTALAWATRHYQTVEQERDAALAKLAELEAKLSDPTAVHQWQFSNAWFDGSEEVVLKAGKEGSPIRTLYAAPVAQAQPEETPGEILAAKLIETWVTKHGKPAPWSTAVEITAVATNMPNDERERLLALDDDVDAQAQHSVPEGFRELLEMLVVSDLRKIRYAGAWRREVHDRASSILALLAAAPGKEGL